MAKTFTSKIRKNLQTTELLGTDLTWTTETYVKTSNVINVSGAESLTLSVKTSVASLVYILDADATTALGVNCALYTSSSGTLAVTTQDLRAKAVNNIKIVVDGQTGAPTITMLLRKNTYVS